MFPQVSKDTRTAKKTVSRLGGYAAPNFRFFAILMHARDRSISGGGAEQRAVSLLGSLQRNRAGGRRGAHMLDNERPTMLTPHAGIDFSDATEDECSAARRSSTGELPSPCTWCRKNQTTCPRPASRDSRHVLTARGRQVTLPTPPSLPKKRELLCLAAEAGQPRGCRRATSASGLSGPAACRCARSKHRLRSRRRRRRRGPQPSSPSGCRRRHACRSGGQSVRRVVSAACATCRATSGGGREASGTSDSHVLA